MGQTRPAAQQAQAEVQKGNALVRYQGTVAVAMPKIAEILPATIKSSRFEAAAVMAFKKDADLGGCSEESIVDSLREAATDGLLLDGKEAALVVRKGKGSRPGNWRCCYMPMFQGMVKKVRGSGPVKGIEAHVVYENDDYTRYQGSSPRIEHIPARRDRGNPELVYAIAFFKDDHFEAIEMDEEEIDKVRSKAQTDNVWDEWEMEMWKKSALRRIYKTLPKEGTGELGKLIDRWDEGFDLEGGGEPEPGDEPEKVDTETGEVIDQEPVKEEQAPPPSRAEQAATRRAARTQQRKAKKEEGSGTRSRPSRSQAKQGGPAEPDRDYQPPGDQTQNGTGPI